MAVLTSVSPARRLISLAATAALCLTLLVTVGASAATADEPGAIRTIAFEPVNRSHVVLDDLASRSQRKPIDISGIGPYAVRGTDSRSGEPYSFVTDSSYVPTPNHPAWGRESDERGLNPNQTPPRWTSSTASFGGRTGALLLESYAWCAPGNEFDGLTTYCSAYGPDVYTVPFEAREGQAVSFDWAAEYVEDDYEVYAFLVPVDGTGYGSADDHIVLAHGRGTSQGWTTTTGLIPEDGTYRFRFVNGSYDRTGGHLLGSRMYIDSVVRVGTANPIDFPALGDRIRGTGSFELAATAPGGAVTYRSNTPNVCTVSGATVSLVANATGTCTIVADQAGDGVDYVPADSVAVSFRVLAAPTAPTNAGPPFVTGTIADGETVTADEGTWTDGGDPVTDTTYQWRVTRGGNTEDLPGQNSATCLLQAEPGSQLSVVVTKTNGIGSSSSASAQVIDGYTCITPTAPSWPNPDLGVFEVGEEVDLTLAAGGGPTPTYEITAGDLPAGLTFDAATGRLSGTPTGPGPYSFTITATNSQGATPQTFSGTVVQGPGEISGASGPGTLIVGQPATGSVSASGEPAPTYSLAPGSVLPAGVTLNPTTGAFEGSPLEAGDYLFTVVASNGYGTDTQRTFSGTVLQAPSWNSTGDHTPQVGVPFSAEFTAEGSPAPTYEVRSGALPDGLELDSQTGIISGEPTVPGTFTFTLVAVNNVDETEELPITWFVTQSPGAITGDPGAWQVGQPATGQLDAIGTPDVAFSVTDGWLPDGVLLDPATGAFSGSPQLPGRYTFTVTANNNVGDPATREFVVDVTQAPRWTDSSLQIPQIGVPYSDAVQAEGSPAPTYSVTAGALPSGLTLDASTGAVTGTPDALGVYAFVLTADNGVGDPVSVEFAGVVHQAPTATTPPVVGELRTGTPVRIDLSVPGTPAPTYRVSAGSLPDGLTLDPVTGLLSGTPTTPGDYSFSVTADNGVGEPLVIEFAGEVLPELNPGGGDGTTDPDTDSTGDDAGDDRVAGISSTGPVKDLLPATGAGASRPLLALAILVLLLGTVMVAGRRRSPR